MEKYSAFRVGNGNFENSKLFEGLVILRKKRKTTKPKSYIFCSLSSGSSLLFSCLLFSSLLFSSLLFSSLLFSSLLFSSLFSSLLFSSLLLSLLSLVFRLLVACLSSCLLSSLVLPLLVSRLAFSCLLSMSLSVCLRVLLRVVLCGCCGVCCGVWCDTLVKPLCVDSKRPRVYRHHAHMCFHMWAWCQYTRGRFGRTQEGVGRGVTVSAYRNLPT